MLQRLAPTSSCQGRSAPLPTRCAPPRALPLGHLPTNDLCEQQGEQQQETRRWVLGTTLAAVAAAAVAGPAQAYSGFDYKQDYARRRKKVPLEDFTDGPQGLKMYDIIVGGGAEAKEGQRVAVHYDVKFRNITFVTSRMGMGVTGGTPVGFNVGVEPGSAGSILPGIDLGIRGMRVGGLRRLIVPPELAYGSVGVGEIPPNATLNIDVELLSIKTSPVGFRTKLVEG